MNDSVGRMVTLLIPPIPPASRSAYWGISTFLLCSAYLSRPAAFGALSWDKLWSWFYNKLCQASEVLGDSCEHELVLGIARTPKTEAAEPQNALQVCEPHLDAFTVMA